MRRVPSVIPLPLSLEWNHSRTRLIRQITILPGRIPSIHVAMSSVLWKATLGQLTRGPPMAHHCQAHLLSTLPDPRGNQVLRRHQPALPHMRQHVLPPSCLSPLCQPSLRFTRPPWCVLRNQKARRVCRRISKQAVKSSLCPNTLQHRFARANRRRHL
jgi:hypothetical protein